jgi:DNA mismatch repair protein MutL
VNWKIMPIRVLPLQLANQISAGEVVERPAAVVKELLENSIDAGATQITLDIEAGGVGLIRVRDNGSGIPQTDLRLALARHATSKISSLEELQSVTSLGFRGEALASISAVSRVTLVSRAVDQAQAWQLYCEGGEGTNPFKPASHPVGTTLEVCDLFYNTPARRKFLRSAKTEFSHIDEVVRRVALSQLPLELMLTHNGKRIRHYRPVLDPLQPQLRLVAACGAAFAEHAVICRQRDPYLTILGWVAPPSVARLHHDLQYCAINGRVVRDRVVSHAVRQAYHDRLTAEQSPAFVLFLTLDPQQVDVNVHPTKQEVRFQQARSVHGLIYQAVMTALQGVAGERSMPTEQRGRAPTTLAAAGRPTATVQAMHPPKLALRNPSSVSGAVLPTRGWQAAKLAPYQALLQSARLQPDQEAVQPCPVEPSSTVETPRVAPCRLGRFLTIWQQQYAVLEQEHGLTLVSLPLLKSTWQRQQLLPVAPAAVSQQRLVLPLRFEISAQQAAAAQHYQLLLAQLALVLECEAQTVTLRAVPSLLYSQDLQPLCLQLLDYLVGLPHTEITGVVAWLVQQLTSLEIVWQSSQAIQLLAEVEREAPRWLLTDSSAWQQPVDLALVAARFATE